MASVSISAGVLDLVCAMVSLRQYGSINTCAIYKIMMVFTPTIYIKHSAVYSR